MNPLITFLAGMLLAALIFVAALGGLAAVGYTLTRHRQRDIRDNDSCIGSPYNDRLRGRS